MRLCVWRHVYKHMCAQRCACVCVCVCVDNLVYRAKSLLVQVQALLKENAELRNKLVQKHQENQTLVVDRQDLLRSYQAVKAQVENCGAGHWPTRSIGPTSIPYRGTRGLEKCDVPHRQLVIYHQYRRVIPGVPRDGGAVQGHGRSENMRLSFHLLFSSALHLADLVRFV
jgi:hypothetical protein